MLNSILDTKTPKEQKDFAVQLGDMVLANLEPFGRSRLYTQKLQQNLVNTINNVDPSADLYSFLGVDATADEKKIKRAYQEKTSKLKKDKSPEAKTKLEQVERAFTALKTPARKQRYDEYKAEPTITHRQLNQKTYYIKIHKFSPIAYQELVEAFNAVNENNKTIDSLVLDLRGNIGGAIDLLPYFLGPFIGQNNYAFEYFSRGTSTPYKTLTDRLPGFARYKKIVILIDEQTQSSAEVMASTLKKYNVGVLVGSTTKGWGTIEKIFELKTQIAKDEKYSVFLVHTLTLGDKNQPIEGRGIQPMININTNDWETQLLKYFESGSLVNEIKKLYQK